MAFAFRIHNSNPQTVGATAPVSAATMSGWTQTAYIAGSLLANININNAHGKIGTSIPSIFARMFLFDIAFQSFLSKSIEDIVNPPEHLKMEAGLISECLDLLEFLFQHGSDPKLVIKRWDGAAQIAALKESHVLEHRRLASVFADEIANYPALASINLFYWRDSTANSIEPQEFLIGGSSPMTLVFTAPNWKETMQQNGFSFSRTGDGSRLFDSNQLRPLTQRAVGFKNMIYSMRMAFHQQFRLQAANMEAYIDTSYESEPNMPNVDGMANQPTLFYNKFEPIKDEGGAPITAAQLPLCYEPIRVVSGYEMKPTVNRYSHDTNQNGRTEIPLMLDKNGLIGVSYIGESRWNTSTCIINEAVIRNQPIYSRELPGGMGIKYPFLIWSDLLEDKIMKVPFVIDNNNFITATTGDSSYLLPLRRNFFQYFEVQDIKRMLTIQSDNNQVKVKLHIDLNNITHPYIDIEHTYTAENIVNLSCAMGIFPFYKTNGYNAYRILQCGGHTINARFFDVNGTEIASPHTIRTSDDQAYYETRYYDVRHSFDYIELTHDACSALIVPQMKFIDLSKGTEHFTFSVDFGTTNTYVAYKKGTEAPGTLEFGGNDQQTVYMYKRDSSFTGTLGVMMMNYPLREFTPEELGTHARFRFPTTTATCELAPIDGRTPSLFGTISMGFNMLHEMSAIANARYTTQLKWLLEKDMADPHNNALILCYFTQILWMLKNKAIQNGGNDAFTVCLTFPEAMPIPVKTALVSLWNQAKTELNLQCIIDSGFSESLAPYNIMVPDFGTDSFLNIDIGGGTHDILFINRDNTGKLVGANYSSARFAGDDLWGDGTIITDALALSNGFVDYLYNKIEDNKTQYPTQVVQSLETLKNGLANTSGDVMSFLFSHDTTFHTSTSIRANAVAYSLVFIHYMALMYHVARLIKKQNIGIPNYISFTGMGSKYMNLISPDSNNIKELTKLLLEKYTGLTIPRAFKIVNNREDAKEITAKGALTIPAPNYQIPNDLLKKIVDYGFDTQQDITYAAVRTQEVQEKVLAEYTHFLDSLQDATFAQFLHDQYGLTIPDNIVNQLRIAAQNSYNTISTAISTSDDTLKFSETLFFFPLKNALIKCSQTIQ